MPQNSYGAKPSLASSFATSKVVQNSEKSFQEVRVDMADMKVETKPVVLITNVGSCVAICIHDSVNKSGGLAHIMLPDSKITKNDVLVSKYADTAVPALAEALRKSGRSSFGLSAKIAGGANMFSNLKANSLNIGEKNVEAVKEALENNGIKLLAEDVRGTCGRRVAFNIVTGKVHVRCGNKEVTEI
ncbi:MAG: chemotaxis protein CheD [Candidatus Bathyarchaeota archaeon]|nr:chemotaxis protein CheD [Candidatus Bathyarchaeota archaeon]